MLEGTVLVTGTSVAHDLLQPLRDAGLNVKNPKHLLSQEELAAELKTCRAYLLGGEEIATATAIDGSDVLEIIAFLGVGYEPFIDVVAATKRGVLVSNTPGTLTDAVSEFTVGMILTCTRRITEYINSYRRGEREVEEKQHDLAQMRVGIVGLGNLGTRIAEILTAYRCTIQYYSRTRKPQLEESLGIEFVSLNRLVATSDVVVLMTPGTESTQNMFNAELLADAKRGMILVNTARREIVDPAALRMALSEGIISIAAYDDFYDEPVGQSLLNDFPESRLLVTGHIGSLTHQARDGMAKRAVTSILDVLRTGTNEYVVNGKKA
jgi:glyoxylate reductase